MKKSNCLLLTAILLLNACTSHQKTILLYANSDIQVDESQKNVTVTDGNTQIEKELTFTGSDPVTLNITAPKGRYSLEANGDGLFLANLKTDTIVGSLQHTGNTKQTRITQDRLKLQLDSLNKLIMGANISDSAKNYYILPAQIQKISTFANAKIFGPFTPIPSAFDASSVPEVYKFYNLSEEREIISKLTEMTQFKYEKEEKH